MNEQQLLVAARSAWAVARESAQGKPDAQLNTQLLEVIRVVRESIEFDRECASEFSPRRYTIDDEKLAAARYEAWMRVRLFAMRAHQICNLLRLANPEIGELQDDGCLHEAIHDLMRVDWPMSPPVGAGVVG